MADQKPPRLSVGELDTLLALLRYQRESLVRKLDGLTAEQAAWSPVPSGTSLLWLVVHMRDAEETWIVRRFAGLATDEVEVPPEGPAGSAVADAVARYRAMWETTDALVTASGDPDAQCRGDATEPPVNLRWVVAHLLEETARHAGHADILRESVDGEVGR